MRAQAPTVQEGEPVPLQSRARAGHALLPSFPLPNLPHHLVHCAHKLTSLFGVLEDTRDTNLHLSQKELKVHHSTYIFAWCKQTSEHSGKTMPTHYPYDTLVLFPTCQPLKALFCVFILVT